MGQLGMTTPRAGEIWRYRNSETQAWTYESVPPDGRYPKTMFRERVTMDTSHVAGVYSLNEYRQMAVDGDFNEDWYRNMILALLEFIERALLKEDL